MTSEPASGAGKRDALTYLLPVIVGNVVPLITLPLITRQVDVAAYGAWALCTVYGMFVTTVANFGLPLTVERDMFEQPTPEARGALLYSALLFVGSLLAVTIAATWWFGPALAGWLTESPANASLLLLTTCANAVMTIKAYYLMYLRSVSDARSYVRYSLDETIVSAATTLTLLYTTSLGVLALPIGLLTAGSVVFVLATRHFLRLLPFGIALRSLMASLRTP
jgi:O-antigen/teichoic acid export membrane protein